MEIEKFHYTKPDTSKRNKKGVAGGHIVTRRSGLYNQNLTVEELCLLRCLLWDYKESHNTHEFHEFTKFIHSWLFTDRKVPVIWVDIVDDIENGVRFQEEK